MLSKHQPAGKKNKASDQSWLVMLSASALPGTDCAASAVFREPLHHALKTAMDRPDWTIPDYDLVTTYWLHSLDDMQNLTMDPEWAELEKEAAAISNMSIGQFVVGHEKVQFEGNKAGAGA
ncbi:hypothetical protein VM1G_02542 [Cytospora mali]|uniref:EthD domain-containing protein n=1 Tax=Cytospora mali TaxID=578113 RepID=A0A194VRQ8_CYTMA|nr:hypothetical protein VM1G_02542 [Valsa mali]